MTTNPSLNNYWEDVADYNYDVQTNQIPECILCQDPDDPQNSLAFLRDAIWRAFDATVDWLDYRGEEQNIYPSFRGQKYPMPFTSPENTCVSYPAIGVAVWERGQIYAFPIVDGPNPWQDGFPVGPDMIMVQITPCGRPVFIGMITQRGMDPNGNVWH
ncbi:uncharacterized protein BCR38DRAFT_157195 [Pseudomassariella vexata]|uniref:Uncharacterized protein n=1 Tax=Pseudomassariella vexata TaxID=1141098 RepID=A0A1Y2E957_9PEZI|nr:uncharacterized protein BCR38DRAFT_157195 [Pseudomassariella vexata]ORY67395.1 hypothetical protein BCR38DRAFT_157195 [Pseudomassariella vexata]